MRIAFVDFTPWDYTPLTPDKAPLGGTQSAVCYLARQLAADGQAVSLINGAARPALVEGVAVVPLTDVGAERVLADCQVAVLISTGHAVRKLKALLARDARLVLWTQHAADQPAVQPLAESEVSALVDHFVFVSRWQQAVYERAFAIRPERCRILRNAVGPAFAGLFADGRAALAAKARPPRLAYTSTPFRGLETLLDVFPAIRAAVPGVTLAVYSSMQVYHLPAGAIRPTMAICIAARRRPKELNMSVRCRSLSWPAPCGRSTCWRIPITSPRRRALPRWKHSRRAAAW